MQNRDHRLGVFVTVKGKRESVMETIHKNCCRWKQFNVQKEEWVKENCQKTYRTHGLAKNKIKVWDHMQQMLDRDWK